MSDSRQESYPWEQGDEITALRLETTRSLAQMAQLTAGSPNVRLYRSEAGTAISVDTSVGGRDRGVVVRIDSNRTGRGWYKGYIWTPKTTEADTATAPSEGTAGTQGAEVSVLNLHEIVSSETNHDLTHADNTDQRLFLGRFSGGSDQDGFRVVHINGIWVGC